MNVRLLLLCLAWWPLAACKAATDLGEPCRMVKRNPVDGGKPIFIREGEIKVGANKDFISFGTVECENLTCVRDADFLRDGGGLPDPAAAAEGYCSDKCQAGSTCSASDPKDDVDARRRLACRPLLLDEETLKALCAAGACLPGGIKSPYFCARGGAAVDAGI